MLENKLLENYLKDSKVIEDFDLDKNTILYKNIKQNQIIKTLKPEEKVRAFLMTKLVKELGYNPELIEIEKTYDIGRPKVNKPRADIILKEKNNKDIFLFIELKAPEEFDKDKDETIEKQLYNIASQEVGAGNEVKYLMLYTYEILENTIKDKCIIIDYKKYSTFNQYKEERNFADTIPSNYGLAKKQPFIKGSNKDLEKSFTDKQLTSLQNNLHNVLWGGGSTDDNDVFSSLVNIILAKIQDENDVKNNEEYNFQIFSHYTKDNKEIFEDNATLFERINNLYRKALKERLNIQDEDKIKKSYVIDENKFSLSKLKYTVSELERFSFIDAKNSLSGKDILGDFFEGIIREGFKQTKGQFFTPINIVKFMLYGIQADKLAIKNINEKGEIPYMIDPSAGSGTFLIEYMKFITENIKYRFKDKINNNRSTEDKIEQWFYPDHRENKWAKDYIYGIEINFNLGTSTKVNMILHGDGSTNIFVKDGLLSFNQYTKSSAPNALNQSLNSDNIYKKITNEQFDVILSNPPFSVTLDKQTQENIKDSFLFSAENSENLFIERWYQLLKENGRLAVVLPENIFDTTENKYIRLFLYKFFNIKAIISLPQLTFEPYTSTKTSLLFAQKKTKQELEKWDDLWAKYSLEYSNLRTRVENLIDVYLSGKNRSKLPSIKDLTEYEEKEILIRFLKNYFDENDKDLSVKYIIEKYQEDLKEVCKLDKNTQDVFGFVNTWWVFGEIAENLDYEIFMAEVENIGYKRTKRGVKITENELYRTETLPSGKEQVLLGDEDGKMDSVLDYLRMVEWR